MKRHFHESKAFGSTTLLILDNSCGHDLSEGLKSLAQPNPKEKLKELSELNSWKRAEFIEKGGWDKMPGQEKAAYGVARACGDGLDHLIKK